MADTTYSIKESTLTAIADAIREKTETTGGIDVADMAELIGAIEAGGGLNGVWGMITPANTSLITIEHRLGKRPVAWGTFATTLGSAAADDASGHNSYVRDGVTTGNLEKTATKFSQYAKNVSGYGKHGIATTKYLDTEDADSISETKYYDANRYVNKNFMKILPSNTYAQDVCTVGETYIWWVLGMD